MSEGDTMKNKYINKPIYKHILIATIVIIYLYASYELKVVRGYNQQYQQVGMSDSEIIIGAFIIIGFAVRDIYNKLKLRRILNNQLRKHKHRK